MTFASMMQFTAKHVAPVVVTDGRLVVAVLGCDTVEVVETDVRA